MSQRLVHVEHVWDTAVSLHLLGADAATRTAACNEIVAFLHHVDDVFSGYRSDSELSRWHRDGGAPGVELAEVLALAEEAEEITDGYFALGWNGLPDPTGIVKGWAVERSLEIAARHGIVDLMVNAGGDFSARGSPEPGKSGRARPWRSGISDPRNREAIIAVVEGHRLDLATSGPSERGEHIVGREPRTVLAASVLGPDEGSHSGLAMTDAIATAAVSAGDRAPELLVALDARGWRSQLMLLDGSLWHSPGWPGVGP